MSGEQVEVGLGQEEQQQQKLIGGRRGDLRGGRRGDLRGGRRGDLRGGCAQRGGAQLEGGDPVPGAVMGNESKSSLGFSLYGGKSKRVKANAKKAGGSRKVKKVKSAKAGGARKAEAKDAKEAKAGGARSKSRKSRKSFLPNAFFRKLM